MFNSKKRNLILSAILTLCLIFLNQACNTDDNLTNTSISKDYSAEELFRGIFFAQGDVANKIPEIKESFPDLTQLKAEVPNFEAVLEQTRSNFIAAVRHVDPLFLDKFKKSITSGDPLKIREIFKESNEVLMKAHKYAYRDHLKELNATKAKMLSVNLKKLINSKNEFDLKALEKVIEENKLLEDYKDVSIPQNQRQNCATLAIAINAVIWINVAIGVNIGVALNAAITVNLAFAINAAAAKNAAIHTNVTISAPSEGGKKSRMSSLKDELLIDKIATTFKSN